MCIALISASFYSLNKAILTQGKRGSCPGPSGAQSSCPRCLQMVDKWIWEGPGKCLPRVQSILKLVLSLHISHYPHILPSWPYIYFLLFSLWAQWEKKSTNSNIHAKQHGWRNLHCRQLYSIRHGCHSCPHTVVLPNNDCMFKEGNSAPLKGRCHCSSTNYPTAKSTTFCLAGW